jgi:hypothetical protein
VATTGAKTTWATGVKTSKGTAVLAKWNGSTWDWVKSFPLQGQPRSLAAITAGPKGIAFTVGGSDSREWTGNAWKKVTVAAPPGTSLGAVTFAPGGAVWAAGNAAGQVLIMHWNGREWARVASPNVSAGVAALSFSAAGYCWAVGGPVLFGDPRKPLLLHWNGHAWS